ncbi:rhodanese-like domain-containing protein, partial [Agrobacterium fabrum]
QGASRSFADVEARDRSEAQKSAAAVAARAGVRSIALSDIGSLQTPDRTTYLIDVRTEPEYLEGHLPGFMHVPGGQLVQETDHYAPELFKIGGLPFGFQFFGLGFGGLFQGEPRRGKTPTRMCQLCPSISGVADNRSHLIGVHLIGWHEVDEALGVLSPF